MVVSDTAVYRYVPKTLSHFQEIIIFNLHSVAKLLTDIKKTWCSVFVYACKLCAHM